MMDNVLQQATYVTSNKQISQQVASNYLQRATSATSKSQFPNE